MEVVVGIRHLSSDATSDIVGRGTILHYPVALAAHLDVDVKQFQCGQSIILNPSQPKPYDHYGKWWGQLLVMRPDFRHFHIMPLQCEYLSDGEYTTSFFRILLTDSVHEYETWFAVLLCRMAHMDVPSRVLTQGDDEFVAIKHSCVPEQLSKARRAWLVDVMRVRLNVNVSFTEHGRTVSHRSLVVPRSLSVNVATAPFWCIVIKRPVIMVVHDNNGALEPTDAIGYFLARGKLVDQLALQTCAEGNGLQMTNVHNCVVHVSWT